MLPLKANEGSGGLILLGGGTGVRGQNSLERKW
jgi:hypothetical protein